MPCAFTESNEGSSVLSRLKYFCWHIACGAENRPDMIAAELAYYGEVVQERCFRSALLVELISRRSLWPRMMS